MKRLTTLVEGFGHYFALKLIMGGILICAGLIMASLFLLADKTKIEAFRAIGALVFLFGLLIAIFPAKEVYTRMTDDKSISFTLAIAHTWYHYLLLLAFIPVVGPLLRRFAESKKERRNPFVSDER
jgi:hypothetical protein